MSSESFAAPRLMTAERGGSSYQDRLVAELARIIAEENQREEMHLGADPYLVAYTLVPVLEGFIYNSAIAAVEPRLENAMQVVDFILR